MSQYQDRRFPSHQSAPSAWRGVGRTPDVTPPRRPSVEASSLVVTPRSTGVRDTEDQVDKLLKQNFDLKLEVFHLREWKVKAERRWAGAEKCARENEELQEANRRIMLELKRRDQAVDEAVVMICDLEEKLQVLQEELERLRAASTEKNRRMNKEVNFISEGTSAVNDELRSREESDKKSGLPQRLSFIDNPKPSTTILRGIYFDGEKAIRPIPSYATIASEHTSNVATHMDEDEILKSPAFSVISESELRSLYGYGQDNKEQLCEESPTLGKARIFISNDTSQEGTLAKVSRWINGGTASLPIDEQHFKAISHDTPTFAAYEDVTINNPSAVERRALRKVQEKSALAHPIKFDPISRFRDTNATNRPNGNKVTGKKLNRPHPVHPARGIKGHSEKSAVLQRSGYSRSPQESSCTSAQGHQSNAYNFQKQYGPSVSIRYNCNDSNDRPGHHDTWNQLETAPSAKGITFGEDISSSGQYYTSSPMPKSRDLENPAPASQSIRANHAHSERKRLPSELPGPSHSSNILVSLPNDNGRIRSTSNASSKNLLYSSEAFHRTDRASNQGCIKGIGEPVHSSLQRQASLRNRVKRRLGRRNSTSDATNEMSQITGSSSRKTSISRLFSFGSANAHDILSPGRSNESPHRNHGSNTNNTSQATAKAIDTSINLQKSFVDNNSTSTSCSSNHDSLPTLFSGTTPETRNIHTPASGPRGITVTTVRVPFATVDTTKRKSLTRKLSLTGPHIETGQKGVVLGLSRKGKDRKLSSVDATAFGPTRGLKKEIS